MANYYFRALRRWAWLRKAIGWTKSVRLPGFEQVSPYDTIVFLIRETQRNDLTFRSYAIAYTFFISLFPSVLVIFTLIPFLPIYAQVDAAVYNYFQDVLPGQSSAIAYEFIHDIATNPRGGLLSLSFILALYFSSAGMMAMMRTFEKHYPNTYRSRNMLRKRLVAIGLTLSLGLLLIASVILTTVGTAALNFLSQQFKLPGGLDFALRALQWLAIGLLIYGGVSITYRYGASTIRRFNVFTPGATLASFLCILTSLAFSIYISNFDSYNRIYGSIGTIIIFMLWLQLNVMWIMIGYELNASIAVNRDLKRPPIDEDSD